MKCKKGHNLSKENSYKRKEGGIRCLTCQRENKAKWRSKEGMIPRTDPSIRFWRKVEKTDSCWIYRGQLCPKGYGRFDLDGKNIQAHRFSFIEKNGEIEKGLVIDHKCRVTNCVNPDHLEPVTNKENVIRGKSCNPNLHRSLPRL